MTNSYAKLLKTIGDNVKKYRNKENLTQTQLGIKLGKTKEYIYMIEKGMRSPSLKTIVQIAHVLNVDFKDLTEGS